MECSVALTLKVCSVNAALSDSNMTVVDCFGVGHEHIGCWLASYMYTVELVD